MSLIALGERRGLCSRNRQWCKSRVRHWWSEGERKVEGRPLSGARGIGPDFASVGLDGGTRGGQPKATALVSLFVLRHAIEALKNTIQILGGQTLPLISDTYADLHLIGFQLKPDGLSGTRIGDSVIEQVIEDLLNAQSITEYGRHIRRNIQDEAVSRGILLPALHQLEQQFSQGDLSQM